MKNNEKIRYWLKVIEGQDQGKTFPVRDEIIVIGRSRYSDIVLSDIVLIMLIIALPCAVVCYGIDAYWKIRGMWNKYRRYRP